MKPILIIDAGHGGKDSGGGSSIFYDPNGFHEKDMVLKISLYQYERFKELGVPVALTRSTDVYMDSTTRTDKVKASGAKYCISNHINAVGIETAKGAEVAISIYEKDKTFANSVLNNLKAEGADIRPYPIIQKAGANGKDYYFMLRETGSVITTIIEYGFATNRSDNEKIKRDWKAYAEAVVKSFCSLIGHTYSIKSEEDKEGENLRKEIDALKQENKELKKQIELIGNEVQILLNSNSMRAPDWAEEAINWGVEKGVLDTPEGGSYDFYRLATMLNRYDKNVIQGKK